MLKVRILTALVLLPVALLIFFVLPEDAFAISVGLIVLVGAWEWIRLSGLVNPVLTWVLLALFAGILVWSYLLPPVYVPMLLSTGCRIRGGCRRVLGALLEADAVEYWVLC